MTSIKKLNKLGCEIMEYTDIEYIDIVVSA